MSGLLDILRARIAEAGPISVAEYMRLCLAHPEHGYYMKKDPLGAQGDFITAPEISQIFGELIGLWLATQWEKLGRPKATLLELGPGRGTLMADLLRATQKIPGFHAALSVRLLEISPALKQKQWQALAGKHADLGWLESLDALAPQPLFFVANEFFDALPIRQFVECDGEWRERLIECVDGQLRFTIAAEAGATKETCEEAGAIMAQLAAHIAAHGGAGLAIDYGYTQGSGDTLQAMRKHRYFEVLGKPGQADITAHVDFAALAEAAKAAGARVFGAVPQGKFLMKIGAGQRVQRLVAGATKEESDLLIAGLDRLASPEKMGEIFKVMAISAPAIEHAEGF
jgi:NADH dehydrogenase [ubiquinone] 1 alpha subcomplex assembly factor 7